MFDYVVDYVIIEFEALNTSIWFCCLSQNYLVDYCSHGESRKKKYQHFKCAHIIIVPTRTTNKHTLPLPSKQPTLSKQYSSPFQNIHHHTKAFCSKTTNSFNAPTLPFITFEVFRSCFENLGS
jgi:hypothetical protein